MTLSTSSVASRPVGIIGMGIMGRGIAEVLLLSGKDVLAVPGPRTPFETQMGAIEKSLKRSLRRAGRSDELDTLLARVHHATDLSYLSQCDMVIEAINEDLDRKVDVLTQVQDHLHETAVLGTNTSSLSVTRLAAATNIAERVIGLHFMNPAPTMSVVEVVRGFRTSEDTFERSTMLIESLDKTVVISRDSPGFLLNRILIPMINEAIFTLSDGIGTVESIDRILVGAANHPMGPLELADLIGLDTCLAILQVLHAEMADQKYRPAPLLVKFVEAGWLGRKTSKGFYVYKGRAKTPSWPIEG